MDACTRVTSRWYEGVANKNETQQIAEQQFRRFFCKEYGTLYYEEIPV